jgi:hypothetical protein
VDQKAEKAEAAKLAAYQRATDLDDRNGKLTDILKPLTNDADRKLVLD